MTNWRTPRQLYDKLNAVAQFAVDAAADGESSLCGASYYGPGGIAEDALQVERWLSPAWCNPPYGRGIQRWLAKFAEQQALGCNIVTLLPARTEVKWWEEFVVMGRVDVLFLVGRVPFIDPARTKPSQPDHGSALIIYEPTSSGRVGWADWKREMGLELRRYA